MQFTSLHFLMMSCNTDLSGCCGLTVTSLFELLSFEDQSLLVGMNACLVLTLSMVSLAFDIERDCLAGQRFDDDLRDTVLWCARCWHRRCGGLRIVGVSGSPSFHAESLVTELLNSESCAASAALNSVPGSQLAWYENPRQTSSPLISTTR